MKHFSLFVLFLLASFISSSQNHCECGVRIFNSMGPGHPELLSPEIMEKLKVKKVNIYGGSVITNDTIPKNRPEYRIYRFLYDNGKMTESVHFSFKEKGKGLTVGIPEEYEKYVYVSDTLCEKYSTWSMLNYEERYSFFLTDATIDDFLVDGVEMDYAMLSDLTLNKKGDVIKFKTRHPDTGEVVPDNVTQTYWFKYDDKDRLIEMASMRNMKNFGQKDTLITSLARLTYDAKKRTGVATSIENGKETIVTRMSYDKRWLSTVLETLDENGKTLSTSTTNKDKNGMLDEMEIVSKEGEKTEFGFVQTETYTVKYLPNGLPHYITYKTDQGSCSYVFKYGY